MKNTENAFAILILAAGSSKRMGKAKLLLRYKNETIIEHCVKTAQEVPDSNVYVVTGAYQERILASLSNYPDIQYVHNHAHLDGMGSSIACGVSEIVKFAYKGILLLLPDQILVDSKTLNDIIDLHKTNPSSIILSNYGENSGPPTFFPPSTFSQLLDLEGDKGAKHIFMKQYPHTFYKFPFGMIDIDKIEDCKEFDISD